MENLDQAIQQALSLGDFGMILAVSIAVLQGTVATLKRVSTSSLWMKKYGRLMVILASAVLAFLIPLAFGTSWVLALSLFVANSSSVLVHDLLHYAGLLDHKKEVSTDDQIE